MEELSAVSFQLSIEQKAPRIEGDPKAKGASRSRRVSQDPISNIELV
jgi:hypothetical protein